MNTFITGITGFVGSHMADYVLKHTNDHVYGFKRWMEDTKIYLIWKIIQG